MHQSTDQGLVLHHPCRTTICIAPHASRIQVVFVLSQVTATTHPGRIIGIILPNRQSVLEGQAHLPVNHHAERGARLEVTALSENALPLGPDLPDIVLPERHSGIGHHRQYEILTAIETDLRGEDHRTVTLLPNVDVRRRLLALPTGRIHQEKLTLDLSLQRGSYDKDATLYHTKNTRIEGLHLLSLTTKP